jgi:hypothetical protein
MTLVSYFQGNAGVKHASKRLRLIGHGVVVKDPRAHLHPRRSRRYASEPIEEVGTGNVLSTRPETVPVPEPARPVRKKHFKDWKAHRAMVREVNAVQRELAHTPPELRNMRRRP